MGSSLVTWRNQVFLGSSESMPEIPDAAVHCCVTSPPYFGLREYAAAGQIGQEATIDAYVERLVTVFREVRRVLREDGTLWLNLGDSYCSSDKWGGKQTNTGKHTVSSDGSVASWAVRRKRAPMPGIKPKDLVGVPWRVAFALQADGWWLRDAIVWAKPNAMPSSVTDRCTSSYEMVFMLAKSKTYYADMDAVREPLKEPEASGQRFGGNKMAGGRDYSGNVYDAGAMTGANLRNVWTIPTTPFSGDHPAVMPRELAARCVLIGAPPAGIVLDPFMGSGTVAEVAIGNGREYVGYELNPAYHRVISDRLGLFGEIA